MQSSESKQFISTSASSTDLFTGQSHTRAAENIVECVKLLGNRGGSIGVQGSWGSGKSTVINLAIKQLENRTESDCNNITFDLWEYQKDDFRQSFLNFFIDWAIKSDELTNENYESFEKRINARVEEIDDDRKLVLTWQSVLLLILLMFLPLSYLWLSPFAHLRPDTDPPTFAILFALIVTGTLLVGLLLCLLPACRQFFSDSLSILTKKGEYTTRKRTIRGSYPSTHEFKAILADLLRHLKWKRPRLVVTLDNLDRLTDEKLVDSWAHLRSIVAVTENTTSGSSLIVLAPFDASHVLRAHAPTNWHCGNNTQISEGPQRTDSIEKLFNITIDIHDPILSDWSAFLNELIDEHVIQNQEYSKHIISKIFDESISIYKLPCTPRTIISFVNKLLLFVRSWSDQIPIEVIAAYIALKDHAISSPETLKSDLLPPRTARLLSSYEWRRDFSAMYYNVPLDLAYQTLLGQDIKSALTSENTDELVRLVRIDGGPLVLSEVLENNIEGWASSEPEIYVSICEQFLKLELDIAVGSDCISIITTSFVKLSPVPGDGDIDCTPIIPVITQGHGLRAQDIFYHFVEWLKQSINASEPSVSVGSVSGALCQNFLADVREAERPKIKREMRKVDLPLEPLAVAGFVKTLQGSRFKDAMPRLAYSQSECLNLLANVPEQDEEFYECIPALVTYLPIGDAIAHLSQSLLMKDVYRAPLEFAYVFEGILTGLHSNDRETFNSLKTVYRSGVLLSVFESVYTESIESESHIARQVTAIAFVLLIAKYTVNQIPHPPNSDVGNTQQAFDRFKKFIDHEFKQHGDLAGTIADICSEANLIWRLGELFIEQGEDRDSLFGELFRLSIAVNKYTKLHVNQIISNYDSLRKAFDERSQIAFFNGFEGYVDPTINQIRNEMVQPSASLIRDAAAVGCKPLSRRLFGPVIELFEEREPKVWSQLFQKENDDVGLLIAGCELGLVKLKSGVFREPLQDQAVRIAKGEIHGLRYSGGWRFLLAQLPTNSRVALLKDIYSALDDIALRLPAAEELVLAYPGLLTEYESMRARPDVAMGKLIPALVRSNEPHVWRLLEEADDFLMSVWQIAKDDSRGVLREVVQEVRETSSDRSRELDSIVFLRDL